MDRNTYIMYFGGGMTPLKVLDPYAPFFEMTSKEN